MLVAIAFYHGEKEQTIRLAQWIKDLGGVSNHECFLVIEEGTTPDGVIEPFQKAFRKVHNPVYYEKIILPDGRKWGDGTTNASVANEGWLTAGINIAHTFKCRWFWLESDACPVRSTWLDEIEAEDKRGGKPFTGAYVDIPPHEPHMSGIAVYPPDVASHSLAMAIPGNTAWDYRGRQDTVGKGKAHFTDLIQHEYRMHGEAPSFPTQDSLSFIKPRTAVFHRCKDSSLVDRLRERRTRNADIKIAPEVWSVSVQDIAMQENESLRRFAKDLQDENFRLRDRIDELSRRHVQSIRSSPAVVAPKKRGKPMKKKRVLTEAQKDVLRKRMAHARAAKAKK